MISHCFKCDDKGFVEYLIARDANLYPVIEQCPYCKDIEKYSAEVKKRFATKPLVSKPFAKLSLVQE